MAFVHGKDTKVLIDGYDLSAYLTSGTLTGTTEVADTTVFSSTARSFIVGVRNGTMSFDGLFEASAGASDVILSALLGNSGKLFTVFLNGDTVGNIGYGISAISTRYSLTNPVSAVSSLAIDAQSGVGLERLVSHHALGAETGTVNGTAVDGGAASTNGGQSYIQVTAIAGAAPSVVVTIQDSADGSTDWQTILTHTAVTAANAKQRTAITGTVRRYTRAVITFGGTTTSITVQVGFGRK